MRNLARLTHIEFHKLVEWIKQPDSLKGVKYYSDVAGNAQKALGFAHPISDGSIKEALQVADLKMPEDSYAANRERGKVAPPEVTELRNKVDELEKAVTELSDIIITTSQAFLLYSCHTKSGQHKVPPGQLAELRNKVLLLGDNLTKLDRMPATLKRPQP